jgi:hypothetical protein
MMKFIHTNKHTGAINTLEFEDELKIELVITHFEDFIRNITGHDLVLKWDLECCMVDDDDDFDDEEPVKPKRKVKVKK